MKLLDLIPHRVAVLDCGNFRFWMKGRDALERLRWREAVEVYSDGAFIGISLQRAPQVQRSLFLHAPEFFPPVDLPGIHFQEPQSPQWRLQHRNVTFA